MRDHQYRGFTLVEVAVAIAMSLIIVGTAIATVRVAATTITKARRLSLENGLLRAGVLVAMDDADLWMSLDDPNDPSRQRLRIATPADRGLPFTATASDASVDFTVQSQSHLPEAWWRGFGYYNVYLDGDWSDRNYLRWGDYSLVCNAQGGDYRAKQPAYQKAMIEQLGAFAAMEASPASTNWWYYDGRGADTLPAYFARWQGESGGSAYGTFDIARADMPLMAQDDGARLMVSDRRAMTNTAIHFLTSANLMGDPDDPIDPIGFHHTWMVSKATIGDGGEDLAELDQQLTRLDARDFTATKALQRGKVRYEVVSRADVPEDWPSVATQRIGWYLRGKVGHWIRVTVTDPLTGRQMALSLDAPGSTLYGIRMQRGLVQP